MNAMQTVRRVTVYAAQGQEELIEHFLKLGAKGYTITEARGMGQHASLEDPFTPVTHVRIELLVQQAVGDQIMTYLSSLTSKHLPIESCIENVDVISADHF